MNKIKKMCFMPFFLIMALTFSCANSKKEYIDFDGQQDRASRIYQGADIEKYLLPSLPDWANFDQETTIRKEFQPQYLAIDEVAKENNMSYEECIDLQLSFNLILNKELERLDRDNLPPEKLENIFNTARERVKGGHLTFQRPKYGVIHLVWIDHFIINNEKISILKTLINSKEFKKGFPIFISFNFSRGSIEKFLEENELDQSLYESISSEMFSPYEAVGFRLTNFHININELFKNATTVKFYSPKKYRPSYVKGEMALIKF